MAESTDPNKAAALKAYHEASQVLSSLQDNLPDVDEEGAVDAWVTKAQQYWHIAANNWRVAGIHESGIQAAMPTYNDLAEQVMDFDFDMVPLPVPKSQKQHGASSTQRFSSHLVSSPACSQTMAPALLSRSSMPMPMVSSIQVTTTFPASQSQRSALTTSNHTRDNSNSLPIIASSTLKRVKSVFNPAAASTYDPALFQRPGPSRSSFGLSFGTATLLPSPSCPEGTACWAHPGAAATAARPPLLAINAKDHPIVMLGPQLPDNEEDNDNLASILPGGDEVSEAEASLQDVVNTITSPLLAKAPSRSKPHLLTTKTAFIFDADTRELNAYPTIFLSRPTASKSQDGPPRCSSHPQEPPTHPDTIYNKVAQVTQPKKDQKMSKSKFQDSEVAAPCKRAVVATKVVRKHSPRLSKLPPISLDVSGGGFRKCIPKDFQPVDDGIKSIGVLVVEEDLGDFVKVDGQLWNKQYSTPFICVRCHYAKQPCTVDGIPALSLVDQYCPQGSYDINAFASALNTLEQNNQAITSHTQQYMTDKDSMDNSDGADNEDDEVTKRKAGPSKKKSKSS
ncbi:hypothetical protein F5146DRAFT_1147230 [Armillaria mellea]|nr:hypothetical protein F5146DRAFT_1147230 [Armillaria mellea]